jgi:simple sugar transport system permease protein
VTTDQRPKASRLAGLARLARTPWAGGVGAILVLLIIDLTRDPGYLAIAYQSDTGRLVGNLIDIARAAAPILMISVGMALVIATKGIDLSVGSVMAASGAVSMEFLSGQSDSQSAALAGLGLALALGLALGLVNGALVTGVGLQPFIATLVTMLAARGLAKVITGGQNARATNGAFTWIANGNIVGLPVVFLIALVITVAVAVTVRRTALGLMVEAIGIDPKAARLAGVKERSIMLATYAISGLLASVAGVFATATVMVVDVSNTGYLMEMDAILAVVIGGTSLAGGKFSIAGASVGAVLIATLDKTVVFLGIPSSATPAFKAAVIICLCLAQSPSVRAWFAGARQFGRTRRAVVAS